MISTTYGVVGMSCEHCTNAVRGELEKLAGVTDVKVDLATGEATVTSEAPLERVAVAAAIDEAGYELGPLSP